MTWTQEKHVAAILNDIDPRLARAADSLLDAGLIVQVGERQDDDTGKKRPVYRIIRTAENKSKWIETLCSLPKSVFDALAEDFEREIAAKQGAPHRGDRRE
jgi:hypothetical protein